MRNMRSFTCRLAVVLVAAQVGLASSASASPGDLDATFGTDGWAVTELGGRVANSVSAVAIQSDGAILAGGRGSGRFLLVRYLADGTLDPSFDEDGRVMTSFEGPSAALALAIQPDGKIVVAGYVDVSTRRVRIAVARYLANGSLDTSFGENGRVVVRSVRGWALGVQALSDGRILLAGQAISRSRFWRPSGIVLIRLDESGTVDPTFGTEGTTIADVGYASVRDVVFDEEGDTLVVASTGQGFKVARFGADGALDLTFGGDGIRRYRWDDPVRGTTIALDGAGRILIAGPGDLYSFPGALVRLTATGKLDESFSGDGIVELPLPTYGVCGLLLQSDGKIVLGGALWVGGGSEENHSLLARFAEDGTLDQVFGDEGVVKQPGPSGGYTNGCDDVALQGDGKIVLVTSYVSGYTGTPIMAARFLAA